MKKLFYLLTVFSISLILNAQDIARSPIGGQQPQSDPDKIISIETAKSSLVLKVSGRDGRLYHLYLGPRLSSTDSFNQRGNEIHPAYATFGTDNLFEPAIRVLHNDGNPSLELIYVSHETVNAGNDATLTRILLKDPLYPFEVTLFCKAFTATDVFEQWAEIRHTEKKPVTIYNYASSMLHFDAERYWLTQFHGDWAEEMKARESELTAGIKILDSKLGSRAHMYQTPVFLLSLNEKAEENSGQVLAGTLGWSGNFRFLFEVDEKNSLRVISGINPFASEYSLQPGQVFKTPSMIFTFSDSGTGQASRNLHRWAINHGVLNGKGSRYTLLNNWEATGFNFDEKKLTSILDDTKKMGLDVFLLDDGWFANKYPRNHDRAGLGDWQENKAKLPGGLGYLVKEADARGVKFGIWIEPEMVNPKSELYETHPEWILKLPNRPEHYFRNQLVLDLTNPKVQEFVYNVVDGMLTANPGIAFIKWDCNRMMTNMYSTYLKDKQSHLYIDYVNSLYGVLERLRSKYPDLPIMLCSGGGGRVDYGALKYFTEFWASDNTDPLERIYMQWGYSYFFPAISVCNHVTSWGKQSLKFRTDVAMMGKMGFDIEVDKFSDNELKFCQDAIANYNRIKDVIYKGDLYRLISPYKENRAALMYVNQEKTKAVLFSYTLNTRYGETINRVRLQGLDPDKTYNIREINVPNEGRFRGMSENGRSYTGDYLMNVGLNAGSSTPLTSVVYEITE
ncbi:MAG: alpha-galactosidase [Bacteroidales bacterium]|jgi:alpha-galactosidase|nr:alpha-galactosidase [Bacteroidales bacterium]MBP7038438.1 alpha-galactosidase [Bacteroidales bacterium]MDI9553054.1 alpha-galactosidase [Bacteroidota bacterium]